MMHRTLWTIAGLFVGITSAQAGSVSVDDAWARASMTQSGAVYMELTNSGGEPIKITGAETPVAKMAEIHTSEIDENGVMKMRPVESLPVKAGETVQFAPGGMHVMLMELNTPLEQGDEFPLTLNFDGAEPLEIKVPVVSGNPMHKETEHKHED